MWVRLWKQGVVGRQQFLSDGAGRTTLVLHRKRGWHTFLQLMTLFFCSLPGTSKIGCSRRVSHCFLWRANHVIQVVVWKYQNLLSFLINNMITIRQKLMQNRLENSSVTSPVITITMKIISLWVGSSLAVMEPFGESQGRVSPCKGSPFLAHFVFNMMVQFSQPWFQSFPSTKMGSFAKSMVEVNVGPGRVLRPWLLMQPFLLQNTSSP